MERAPAPRDVGDALKSRGRALGAHVCCEMQLSAEEGTAMRASRNVLRLQDLAHEELGLSRASIPGANLGLGL